MNFVEEAIENSNLIQVYSNTRTVWRGEEWSSISAEVRVDKKFRNSKQRLILHAYVQDCRTKKFHKSFESDQVRISFEKHSLDQSPYMANVVKDAYNTLTVGVHKDLFKDGDRFRLIVVVEVSEDRTKHTIYGASQVITVTDLALSIEERFSDHEKIVKIKENMFVCYSKLAPTNGGLKVEISLKDENGEICTRRLPQIKIETQLVYENGFPAPIMPIRPLKIKSKKKQKNTIVRSSKPIFERLGDELILGDGVSKTICSFNLHEVTYHHHGHDGFKLKVYISDREDVVIHPATMKELIAVLSKPKKVNTTGEGKDEIQNNASGSGKINPVMVMQEQGKLNDTLTMMVQSKRKATALDEDKEVKEHRDEITLPISSIVESYICNGRCFRCHTPIESSSMLEVSNHTVDCEFALGVLPMLQSIDPSLLRYDENDSFERIMQSRSFDETPKSVIESLPYEKFDSNMFAVPPETVLNNELIEPIKIGLSRNHPAWQRDYDATDERVFTPFVDELPIETGFQHGCAPYIHAVEQELGDEARKRYPYPYADTPSQDLNVSHWTYGHHYASDNGMSIGSFHNAPILVAGRQPSACVSDQGQDGDINENIEDAAGSLRIFTNRDGEGHSLGICERRRFNPHPDELDWRKHLFDM